jgi:hypothetical protein
MTAGTVVSTAVRRAAIAVLAVATAAACVIGATDAANATSTRLQRQQPGFGAVVRVAVEQSTIKLDGLRMTAPGQADAGARPVRRWPRFPLG